MTNHLALADESDDDLEDDEDDSVDTDDDDGEDADEDEEEDDEDDVETWQVHSSAHISAKATPWLDFRF